MVGLKRTYRKVILREVRFSLSRFLAIFAIVALGVGFLAGLLAATPDMRLSVDDYYDRMNIMDIRVLSTLGLSEEDIAAIRQADGVEQVEPGYTADVLTNAMDAEDVVTRVHSLSALNQVKLVSGRLPEKPGECAVLKTKTLTGVETGDAIPLSAENDDLTDVLAVEGFTVVGLVETPYYMSIEKETSTVGAGHVQLTLYAAEDSFAYPAYTEANVLVRGAKALNAFTDEYEAAVDTVQTALETLGKTQAAVRFEEVKGEAEEKLADGRKAYDKAKAEAVEKLADARKELGGRTAGAGRRRKGPRRRQKEADRRREGADRRAAAPAATPKKELADGEKELGGSKRRPTPPKSLIRRKPCGKAKTSWPQERRPSPTRKKRWMKPPRKSPRRKKPSPPCLPSARRSRPPPSRPSWTSSGPPTRRGWRLTTSRPGRWPQVKRS